MNSHLRLLAGKALCLTSPGERPGKFALSLILLATASCSLQPHEPTVNHDAKWLDKPWQVHCETARTYDASTQDVPGATKMNWVFASNSEGEPFSFSGNLVDGFFEVATASAPSSAPVVPTRLDMRQLCLNTIKRIEGDHELMLGWVMAARPGEKINVPPVYPDEVNRDGTVTRVVIFGDSLTDTGRLKQRLRVFPAKPYWIGRFSNGPVWPEYLAMSTGLGVQNHSYGGASAAPHDPLPGASLYARIRDAGQFFVSGSIELQVDDYINRTLASGNIERADTTAFLIWGGANDYISKEPATGLITTFLNSPEGESGYKIVVEQVVEKLRTHVHKLYAAGARRFILIDLPDLGRTPIVLQNTTYVPEYLEDNDTARRMELARRLTQLTLYHNQLLAEVTERLRMELPESQIVMVDTFEYFGELTDNDSTSSVPQQYGHDLTALEETLEYRDKRLSLQKPCYSGSYLGTLDPGDICPEPDKAIFWDTVHPTTLSHCWQAWKVGTEMALAGWIHPLPDPSRHLAWCQNVVHLVALKSVGHFSYPAFSDSTKD